MDRREALKRTTLAIGGMISASTLAVIMKGCSPGKSLMAPYAIYSRTGTDDGGFM